MSNWYDYMTWVTINKTSPEVAKILEKEMNRQDNTVELIASENYVSDAIKAACGSVFTNKYAEGKPYARYYGGCENVDELESYCQKKWLEVFGVRDTYHINVQPHSGSQANMAAYMAVLNPGDTILSMSLDNGGHLSHGSKVNFSGNLYNIISYNVDSNGFIDYEDLEKKIRYYQPKLILAGASAYSQIIDFKRIHEIIEAVWLDKFIGYNIDYQPIFMVDMAHIAGLVACGEHPSPFGYTDIITTTTHKTLRGPRGGLIFCKNELTKKIDSAVFPGTQGGPLEHIIAAKAICAEEALTPEYHEYIHNVVINCKAMADEFIKMGYDVITGGTANHLFLIDLSKTHPNLSGKMVQDELDKHNITLNKNCVPNEKRSPMQASGLRIGTAAQTTKGWHGKDFINCAHQIDEIIKNM
jgi:glycine hydroxymethyltransferase